MPAGQPRDDDMKLGLPQGQKDVNVLTYRVVWGWYYEIWTALRACKIDVQSQMQLVVWGTVVIKHLDCLEDQRNWYRLGLGVLWCQAGAGLRAWDIDVEHVQVDLEGMRPLNYLKT